jgi:fused signal recognition particle receptor
MPAAPLSFKERLLKRFSFAAKPSSQEAATETARQPAISDTISSSPVQPKIQGENKSLPKQEAAPPARAAVKPATAPKEISRKPVVEAQVKPDAPAVIQPKPDVQEVEAKPAAVHVPAPPAEELATARKASWIGRLKSGLQRSSTQLTESITGIFTKRKLDESMLDELEDALIMADMGIAVASELRTSLARDRLNKDVSDEDVKLHLASGIAAMLRPVAKPLEITGAKPFIISVVGVNGNGKTTTVAKLAKFYQDQGKKVMLAAGDTFRAAAVEQLQVWGRRLGATVISGAPEADPASVAYRALEQAVKEKADILLIDTAGRLHNKTGLMQELQKIHRVMAKLDETAPHATVLVLDATTGQNAHSQVKVFDEMVKVTGLIVTKLDGTAKGGVVVGLAKEFGKPIHAIGVGESTEDLRPFDADDFAKALLGVA